MKRALLIGLTCCGLGGCMTPFDFEDRPGFKFSVERPPVVNARTPYVLEESSRGFQARPLAVPAPAAALPAPLAAPICEAPLVAPPVHFSAPAPLPPLGVRTSGATMNAVSPATPTLTLTYSELCALLAELERARMGVIRRPKMPPADEM